MTSSVIIATRNRSGPLAECLASLDRQTTRPTEVIVVDSSDDDETHQLIHSCGCPSALYIRSHIASAAIQRNIGAQKAIGDILIFLDDDVVLEPAFIAALLSVFQNDSKSEIAGVGGLMVNQCYTELSWLNQLVLTLCIGKLGPDLAGKVVGPAVNFLAKDGVFELQEVDWLPSGCAAYRRGAFLKQGFPETFHGYSFAEDLYLSTALARTHKLVVTTKARLYHKDLGQKTHKSWSDLAEMALINRHAVMTHVLRRDSPKYYLQLFLYEFVYQTLATLHGSRQTNRWAIALSSVWGKCRGFARLALRRSPHRPLVNIGKSSPHPE